MKRMALVGLLIFFCMIAYDVDAIKPGVEGDSLTKERLCAGIFLDKKSTECKSLPIYVYAGEKIHVNYGNAGNHSFIYQIYYKDQHADEDGGIEEYWMPYNQDEVKPCMMGDYEMTVTSTGLHYIQMVRKETGKYEAGVVMIQRKEKSSYAIQKAELKEAVRQEVIAKMENRLCE